jgi:hypothetical protein
VPEQAERLGSGFCRFWGCATVASTRDPFEVDGVAPGVDAWHCPFCSTFSVSDLHPTPMSELKGHVRQHHPSDYAVVMNEVDNTMQARERKVRDAVNANLIGRRN